MAEPKRALVALLKVSEMPTSRMHSAEGLSPPSVLMQTLAQV